MKLHALVSVALVDPTSGPAVARSSITLLCPTVPCGSLADLHIPFCFWSGFYVVLRSLTHPTVLWHHRLGHPSLPHLRHMSSHGLVSGLPSLLLSPPSPAPPCTPCVKGRLHTTPHSSFLALATVPLQTLHLNVWGLVPIFGSGPGRFLMVVFDDFSRYITASPLRQNSDVTDALIPWLLAINAHCRLPILRPHSDRGVDSSNADARGTCAGGAGFGGAGAGGASFGGAGAGGPRAGGAGLGGVGGGGNGTGGACSGGAGVGGVCFKGAGAGDAGTAPSAMCGPFHLTSLQCQQK
ncbi:unnamed protein product [Closterium sp. NIES-53]